ncbi:MAG: MT-A70 family methyltransferase [Cyanobacteria bacterium P01_A01_bin.80]
MSYIAKSRRNNISYYYLVKKNCRVKEKNNPIQEKKYLGTYRKAYKKIVEMEIIKTEKERFLQELEKKELEDNKLILPVKEYDCIVIDPPWYYTLRNKDKTHRNRIEYPPMKIEEILKLPIKELSKKNSILWLWFTNNHVIEATECIRKWEFELKTILTWEKVSKSGNPRIGTGHWLRNCTEHCFLGIKGKVPSFSHSKKLTNESTIIRAERREHSRKPEEFFKLVEKLCPESKLEMFARQKRQGWDSWGNETEKFN